MSSTMDDKFLFETYFNSAKEFLYQKLEEIQALQDQGQNQLQDLVDKIVLIGSIAALIILALILLSIFHRIRRRARQRKAAKKHKRAAAELKREKEKLRQQRLYYEEQNQSLYGDDLGYKESKCGRGEYRDRWKPGKNQR